MPTPNQTLYAANLTVPHEMRLDTLSSMVEAIALYGKAGFVPGMSRSMLQMDGRCYLTTTRPRQCWQDRNGWQGSPRVPSAERSGRL